MTKDIIYLLAAIILIAIIASIFGSHPFTCSAYNAYYKDVCLEVIK